MSFNVLNRSQRKSISAVIIMSMTAAPQFASAVSGSVTQFETPNGTVEKCVVLDPMPGAKYSEKDEAREVRYCGVDFHNDNTVALCPKTWSTSAGTMIYKIENGMSQASYEANKCGGKDHKKIVKFKQTMNASGTSGTFSTSSLLYYHFSRFLRSTVAVPVAVYRTIDVDLHYKRVSSRAKGDSSMNAAAWAIMRKVSKNPSAYSPTSELFTDGGKQIYGVLVKDSGERYREEINGIRSKWGDAQNFDFMKTPAFTALRTNAPLATAIQQGEALARKDAKINAALGKNPVNPVQMVYWMKELSEIAVLDYIFSQQDRVGNVDFKWVWTWVEGDKIRNEEADSELPRSKMAAVPRPAGVPSNAILLQRTSIGDNDAGGRIPYVNYTKKVGMLESLRHIGDGTYRRLIALADQYKNGGPALEHLKSAYGMSDQQVKQVTTNTKLAADILMNTCLRGELRFDVNPQRFQRGDDAADNVDCRNPGDVDFDVDEDKLDQR